MTQGTPKNRVGSPYFIHTQYRYEW